MENNKKSTHWADITAEKIIAIKGDRNPIPAHPELLPPARFILVISGRLFLHILLFKLLGKGEKRSDSYIHGMIMMYLEKYLKT